MTKINEAIREYNELMGKFNKAEVFFERYPNYFKTNPNESKELEKKIFKIAKQLAALDWIHNHSIIKDPETCLIRLTPAPSQTKLF